MFCNRTYCGSPLWETLQNLNYQWPYLDELEKYKADFHVCQRVLIKDDKCTINGLAGGCVQVQGSLVAVQNTFFQFH